MKQTATKDEYPMRINKYLANNSYCSRREADKLIEEGEVKINGKIAIIGDKINKEDKVEVSEKFKETKESKIYLAYNKPVGVVSHNPEPGQKSIEDVFKYPIKLYPVGRLDKESCGLIILSNDGRIVEKILDPKYEHEKEYEVEVDKPIKLEFIREMEKGVNIEGYQTKKVKVKKITPKKFNIILTEGKNHQIRRMCAALGYTVKKLKRIRVMNIELDKLESGQYKKIIGKELKKLLEDLGL